MGEAGELVVYGPERTPYAEAYDLQVRLRDACIASGGARAALVLVEHPPVITLGRSGAAADVLAPRERLDALGVQVVETNRGGEATLHAPGQLVAYPVLSLAPRGRDLHRYLRDLEAWLIALCAAYGLHAHGRTPETGLWIGERKLASIGIACRRWVTYHGVALNVDMDLALWRLIVPCGMPEVSMTSLAHELDEAPPMAEVAERAVATFAETFGFRRVVRTAPAAQTRG